MSSDPSTPAETKRAAATQQVSMRPPPTLLDLERPVDELSFRERYFVEERIGEGGMGIVQLCRDAQVGRRVAVKTLRYDHVSDERMRRRFVREARIQGQLEHPSIVPVYDIGVDPSGAVYFTMKRVRGLTLREVLKRIADPIGGVDERFSRRRLLGAFGSVCLAVDFAHRRGIVHRDLKPDNIMLGEFGEVSVLDWGIAKLIGEDEEEIVRASRVELPDHLAGVTEPGGILGTPGYMAPEVIAGEAPGPRADVFALGTILGELLSPTPDAEVPPELDAIGKKATATNPDDRFASPRELQIAVERYLDGVRDVELRRDMSRSHSRAAAAAVERARSSSDDVEERRTAMREVGRALALDPENHDALGTMVGLLTTPPTKLPPEVSREIDRSGREHLRWMGGVGAITYVSILAYVPMILWMGVRDARAAALFFVPPLVCAALSFWQTKRRAPSVGAVLASMIVSNVGFAIGSVFFGALVVVPAAVTVNSIAYAVHLQGRLRVATVAVGILALVVPIALEQLGAVAPSYAFVDGTLAILPRAIDFPRIPTLVVLSLSGVVGLVTGVFGVARVRDALAEAERRMYVYTWHLREFVPAEGRAATDPTSFPGRSRAPAAGSP